MRNRGVQVAALCLAALSASPQPGCGSYEEDCALNPYACGQGGGAALCAAGQCPVCEDASWNGDIESCRDVACLVCHGQLCGLDVECETGACVDGVCCESACDGLCESCAAARTGEVDGVCAPVLFGEGQSGECADQGGCGVGRKCACVDLVADGQESDVDCGGPRCPACGSGLECQSPSDCEGEKCQNGVCCPASAACGPCERCDGDGACVPLSLASTGECESGETCSASLECKKVEGQKCESGFECASGFCQDAGAKKCAHCDADADCSASPPAVLCDAGWCKRPAGTACAVDLACASNRCVAGTCEPCAQNRDCASGECDTFEGSCRLAAGQPCTADQDCASGACASGTCGP